MLTKSKIFLLFAIFCFSACTVNQTQNKESVPITVSFWGSVEEIEIMKKTIEPWDKQRKDINIVLYHVPTGGNTSYYVQRLLTNIAGGNAPDVIFMEVNIFIEFYTKEVLLNLTPFINKDKEFNIENFYPDVVKHFTRENKIYVIPRDTAPFNCIYYNKNLFDQEGIPYPQDNWTWDDFLDIAKKLTKRNQKGQIVQYGFWTWCIQNFIYSAGGGYVDNINNPTQCIFNKPQSREGLQFYHDLISVYKVSPLPSSLEIGTSEMFETGHLAMLGSGIWETPRFRKITSFDWDVVSFPRHPKKNSVKVGTGGSGYAILKTTKHSEQAWEVIKCLAGDYGQAILGDTGLAQPANMKIAASEHFAYDGKKPKHKKMLLNSVQHVIYEPFHPHWNEIYGKYIYPEIDLYNLHNQSLDITIKNIMLNTKEPLKNK